MSRDLRASDDTFRASTYLVVSFLLLVIAYLLAVAGISPRFSKDSSPTDLVLAIITFIYSAVSALSLGVLYRQFRNLEQSNMLTLRSWLLIERIEPLDLESPPKMELRLHNVGRVPVVNSQIRAAWRLRPGDEFVSFADPGSIFWGAVYGPGESHPSTLVTQGVPMGDIPHIHSGVLVFIVRIEITYVDTIKTQGRTTAVLKHVPSGSGGGSTWVFLEGSRIE